MSGLRLPCARYLAGPQLRLTGQHLGLTFAATKSCYNTLPTYLLHTAFRSLGSHRQPKMHHSRIIYNGACYPLIWQFTSGKELARGCSSLISSRSISNIALRKTNGKKHKKAKSSNGSQERGNSANSMAALNTANGSPLTEQESSDADGSPHDQTTDAALGEGLKTVTKVISDDSGRSNPGINDRIVFDLQFDTPPVLYIKKYGQLVDIQNLVLKQDEKSNDGLTDIERDGTLTPQSLTQKKIKFIQDAVRNSPTFEKLTEKFKEKPSSSVSPQVSAGETKRSVFTDSDFENIRSDGDSRMLKERDLDLEWAPVKLNLAQLPKYYLTLSKARLTMLVVMTSAAGYGMAPVQFSPHTFFCAIAGIAMASSSANTINQIMEIPFDSQMNRTKNRVLVRGLMSPLHASAFALGLATASTALLYTQVNGLAALLSASNLILYTCIYTPMKRVSILNTWIGSVVGALPPLIGWAAATGALEPGAFILAGVLYSWQFPHFNSLSWNLRPDYSRAGYRMMSVTHPDLCRRVALRHSAACIAICSAAPLLGVTHWSFAVDSLVFNVYLTYLAYKFYEKADSSSSRKLFRFSLIHLPLLMILMWISKARPSEESTDQAISSKPSGQTSSWS